MWGDPELDHRYRAKRNGQSPAEYATAIEGFKRKPTAVSWLCYLLIVALALGAAYLGAK